MSNPNVGSFVPTTNVWDVSEIYSLDGTSPQLKELLVRLYQNLNNMSLSLNTRDAGFYTTQEFVCGQLYFPNPSYNSTTSTTATLRQVFRKVINFGALPNTALKSVDTEIPVAPDVTFTRIYGASTNPSANEAIPLPYVPIAVSSIDYVLLRVVTTGGAPNTYQVNIRTGIDRSAYTITYVVLEYLKT